MAGSPQAERLLDEFPRTVRGLATSMQIQNERCKGELRGPVLWSETMSARASSFGDPDLYVCMTPSHAYDIDENQVLMAALMAVRNAAKDATENTPVKLQDDPLLPGRQAQRRRRLRASSSTRRCRRCPARSPGPGPSSAPGRARRSRCTSQRWRCWSERRTRCRLRSMHTWCDLRTRRQHAVLMGSGHPPRATHREPPPRVPGRTGRALLRPGPVLPTAACSRVPGHPVRGRHRWSLGRRPRSRHRPEPGTRRSGAAGPRRWPHLDDRDR